VDQAFIPESVTSLLRGAEPADLIIGLLTFNDKATAPNVALAMSQGCVQSFPQRRLLVVNCDAGSHDETPQCIAAHVGETRLWTIGMPLLGTSFHNVAGAPGRDSAVRLLAAISDRLDATVCLIVDGNLKSADMTWPQLLADPILDKGADCVLPWFQRDRYEGTLTNTLLAPLTQSLYGKRIPYHLGGAYAFSSKMIRSHLLSQPWEEEVMHYGFDGWVTTMAVAEPLQICRAALGARSAQPKAPGELSTVVAQAVGCIFHLMERYQETWEPITGSIPVLTVGSPVPLGSGGGPINVERMVNAFRQGLRDLLPLWQLILSPETVEQVVELGLAEAEHFHFPSDLWVQVVYDFALAYHDRVVHHEHLLKALTPLYLGHTASFVIQTRPFSAEHVEQELGRLSDHFERAKPYLVQRWRWQNG